MAEVRREETTNGPADACSYCQAVRSSPLAALRTTVTRMCTYLSSDSSAPHLAARVAHLHHGDGHLRPHFPEAAGVFHILFRRSANACLDWWNTSGPDTFSSGSQLQHRSGLGAGPAPLSTTSEDVRTDAFCLHSAGAGGGGRPRCSWAHYVDVGELSAAFACHD